MIQPCLCIIILVSLSFFGSPVSGKIDPISGINTNGTFDADPMWTRDYYSKKKDGHRRRRLSAQNTPSTAKTPSKSPSLSPTAKPSVEPTTKPSAPPTLGKINGLEMPNLSIFPSLFTNLSIAESLVVTISITIVMVTRFP